MNAIRAVLLAVFLMLIPYDTLAGLEPDTDQVQVTVRPSNVRKVVTTSPRESRSTDRTAASTRRIAGGDFETAVVDCVEARVRTRLAERELIREQMNQKEASDGEDKDQDDEEAGSPQGDDGVQVD